MGAMTPVGYAPSTRFYLEDQKQPETRWKTPLPFPVQVVSRVEVIDEISRGKLTTEYRYHHGYWDGAEREFRGFGMVEQLDTETSRTTTSRDCTAKRRPLQKWRTADFSPPTLTKTWFHQGPIGDEFGGWEETNFGAEFWSRDPAAFPRPRIRYADCYDRLAERRAQARRPASVAGPCPAHGAVRAGRARSARTVLHGDRVLSMASATRWSPPGAAAKRRSTRAIFFPHAVAQRTTQWERGDDPMTQFSFTEDYDDYGQPRKQTQIACPRGWTDIDGCYRQSISRHLLGDEVTPSATTMRSYIVDRVASTTTLRDRERRQADGDSELKEAIVAGTAKRRRHRPDAQLLRRQRIPGPAVWPARRLRCPGAYGEFGPHRGHLARGVQERRYDPDPPEEPPYLAPSGSPVWTTEYPQEFRNRLPALAGYTYQPGEGEYRQGYFAATERRRYDFHDDPEGKGGLVKFKRDPLGRDTTIAYDEPYRLLPKEVTDPAGLRTRADYDYRVLQPGEVTDPNGNHTRFTFTPLGLLKDTWVLGKPTNNEGDRQRPSVKMEYDFLAFVDRGQPVSVRTIQQVHHDTEMDVPLPQRDETITTVEYSDGFGRLLQTRTQGEDVSLRRRSHLRQRKSCQ